MSRDITLSMLLVRQMANANMTGYWVVCGLQSLIILLLFFGDIGFDKPGKLGLDFDHFLILMFILICLFIAAVVIVAKRKCWNYLSAQYMFFILLIVAVSIG